MPHASDSVLESNQISGRKEVQMKTNKVLTRDPSIMSFQKMDDVHMVDSAILRRRNDKSRFQ